MIALDLFCGAGGASKGLLDAGFKLVHGIDIAEQPEYFEQEDFSKWDVFKLSSRFIDGYDFIWASPPCQAYSIATKGFRNKGKEYPNLISKTRELLLKTGKPFVIENVPGSPLRRDLMLCGEMFNLRVIRHRIFEIHGFNCLQPEHKKHKRFVWNGTAIPVWTGGRPGCFGNKEHRKYYITVISGGGFTGSKRKDKKPPLLEEMQDAMEIDWISNKKTLAQCVPPKYSEYIGKQFLEGLNAKNKE